MDAFGTGEKMKIYTAPMAGITDYSFRKILQKTFRSLLATPPTKT